MIRRASAGANALTLPERWAERAVCAQADPGRLVPGASRAGRGRHADLRRLPGAGRVPGLRAVRSRHLARDPDRHLGRHHPTRAVPSAPGAEGGRGMTSVPVPRDRSTPRPKRSRNPNMRSTIYVDGKGYWHGRVTIGVRDDGRPDRRHVGGKTKTEVAERVRALERERDQGTVRKVGEKWTVGRWLTYWVENIAAPPNVTENTQRLPGRCEEAPDPWCRRAPPRPVGARPPGEALRPDAARRPFGRHRSPRAPDGPGSTERGGKAPPSAAQPSPAGPGTSPG
jgi:hypothetical protein